MMIASLRPMTEDDLDQVRDWRNAEDVRQNMYTSHLISKQEHSSWWQSQSLTPSSRLLICEVDGIACGVVTFSRYTGAGGSASWAFYSGDRGRRGVGGLMEALALEYAFETLRVDRLECEVLAFNDAVVRFHLKHGFKIEGIAREAHQRDGIGHDVVRLALLSSDWNRHIRDRLRSSDGIAGPLAGTSRSFRHDISQDAVKRYALAIGDLNPIHLDTDAAQAAGFSGAIAHGMYIAGVLSGHFATHFPGPGTVIVSQSLEFLHPALVGREIEVTLRVVAHIGRRLSINISVAQGNVVCCTGTSELLAAKSTRFEEASS